MSLEYIWRTMHCSVIRVPLNRYMQFDKKTEKEKLMSNATLRSLLQKRVFRWHQMLNDPATGTKMEILEGKNCEYKE